ncbi:MAG: hypothetical protein ACT4OD_00980 [Candidatus Nitrosotenuis sp.]
MFTEIEMWVGFYIMLLLLSYAILTSNKKQSVVHNDADALRIVSQALESDEVNHYEIISIVQIKDTTTVIIETNASSIAIEIDNTTGDIISKEKLII